MGYIKLMKSKYGHDYEVDNLICYVADLCKSEHNIAGGNLIYGNVYIDQEFIAAQFKAVQLGRTCPRRMYHIVCTFDKALEYPTFKLYWEVGEALMKMYPGYQSVFALHENTPYPHIHFAVNNCPMDPSKPNLTFFFDKRKVEELVDTIIMGHLYRMNGAIMYQRNKENAQHLR